MKIYLDDLDMGKTITYIDKNTIATSSGFEICSLSKYIKENKNRNNKEINNNMEKVYVVITEYSDCGEDKETKILGVYKDESMAREFLKQDFADMSVNSFIVSYEDLEIYKYDDNYELESGSTESYIKTYIKEFELK